MTEDEAAAVGAGGVQIAALGSGGEGYTIGEGSPWHSRKRTARQPSPPIRQIEAGVLDVGYADAGPADGPAVVLLHGWPYDIHSYADVAPRLSALGYRVVVPYVRGHATPRFLPDSTARNGEQAALAVERGRPHSRPRDEDDRTSSPRTWAPRPRCSPPLHIPSGSRAWSASTILESVAATS